MKNYIIIALSVFALNANATEKEKEKEKELNVLYSADSTRITPRSVTAVLNNMGETTSTYFRHNTYSMPLVKSYSCVQYRGQYDIDSKAEGIFYITTENNPNLPNYRQIISTDNSQCIQPCYPTDTKSYASCSSVHGSGWTGDITYNTYSYCTKGGYLKAEPAMPIYDNCAPPPPPPVIVSPPIVNNPPITNEPPITPTPTPPVIVSPPITSEPPITPTPTPPVIVSPPIVNDLPVSCPAPVTACSFESNRMFVRTTYYHLPYCTTTTRSIVMDVMDYCPDPDSEA